MLTAITKIWLVLRTVKNWPVFTTNYLSLFPRGRILPLHMYGGQTIYIRTGTPDPDVVVNVCSGFDYPLSLFAAKLRPEPVVIDVGANIGAFTVFIKRYFPWARVYAFEPEESNFALLRQNLRVNRLLRVMAVKEAVYDRVGTISFDNDTPNTGAYAVSPTGRLTVSTIDLDTFLDIRNIKGDIDLLKLDCEGSEYRIIESFRGLNRCRVILLEYHHFNTPSSKYNDRWLIDRLTKRGFDLTHHDRKYEVMGTLVFCRRNVN